MDEAKGREVDGYLSEHLFDQPVVATDWPCGYDPECGCYEASHKVPATGGWYDTPDAVYEAVDGGWPPVEYADDPAMAGARYASVAPVPRYSSTGDGMLAVLSAMVAQRFRYMLSRGCRWGEAVESTQAWFYRHDYEHGKAPEEGSATDDDLAAAVALAAARALGWEG